LRLILGFSAGAVIGVVFFDLFPEAILLAGSLYSILSITCFVVIGFVVYMILDRLALLHVHADDDRDHIGNRGNMGAGSLSLHSFLDGVAIGLAFQVSSAIGAIVTIGVVVHDFSDGVNTVGVVLKDNGQKREALIWLFIDAITPLAGVISTLFYKLPQSLFGMVLALFAGFFLYIGASDLLPESQKNQPAIWTTVATVLGIAVIYVAIRLAGL
jgi:ZIP family zinc transporter